GYRDDALNACAGGARRSAHRAFYAADLIPVQTIEKATLARALCAAHARLGAAGGIGLGFYSGMRFHVDAKGLRTWGVDGRSASSPCRAQR
ncbi:MAG: D-Ala-D-Ala carboxypeptidase family metallohydrolase, partial [Hyphomonadaceae bacterium]